MRIISGKYKGLFLLGDNIDGTRPTMDRVKESMFGTIQNHINNSVCLDLFAGSGSLGLEAISNGAKTLYLVDHNKEAINTIKKNIEKNKIVESIYLIQKDYKKALKEFDTKFDIIFLDPPYDDLIINNALKLIQEYELLNKNGVIVCEYEKEIITTDLKLLKEKRIANKKISYYVSK